MNNLLMNEDGLILTNLFALEALNPAASQPAGNQSIADIARRLQMEDDISQINQKMDDLQLELRRFGSRAGAALMAGNFSGGGMNCTRPRHQRSIPGLEREPETFLAGQGQRGDFQGHFAKSE